MSKVWRWAYNSVESTCRLVSCQLSVIVQCSSGCVIRLYIMWILSTVFSMQWFRVCLGGEKRIVFPRSARGAYTSCCVDSINTPSQFGFCPCLTRLLHVAQRTSEGVLLAIVVCVQEVAWVSDVSSQVEVSWRSRRGYARPCATVHESVLVAHGLWSNGIACRWIWSSWL